MILHSIELTYVGPFRETVKVGPVASGLNILAAVNESGKSTMLRAAARALFDKHTTRSEEIKSLQPAGADLAPQVIVEFATGAGRFRIEKVFLQSPRSRLHQWLGESWQAIAEADLADQRVQALLHSSLPGRGATKPEHWGLLGFLWARQGEVVEWPSLDLNGAGQQIRHRLAKVELDPTIEALRAKLDASADTLITATGLPRAGGAWKQAEDDLAALDSELAQLRITRSRLEAMQKDFAVAGSEVLRLEAEQLERQKQADEARQAAAEAERLATELTGQQAALETARERLAAVSSDAENLAKRQAELAQICDGFRVAREKLEFAETARERAMKRANERRQFRPGVQTRFEQLRRDYRRASDLLRLRQSLGEAETLSRSQQRAEKAAASITEGKQQLAQLPPVTPEKLKQIEKLTDEVREAEARLQALGLTIELTPDEAATVEIEGSGESKSLAAGTSETLHSQNALTLKLAGWGRISIRSGAREAGTASNELAALRQKLDALLLAAQVRSAGEARQAVEDHKVRQLQIETAEVALRAHLADRGSLPDLHQATAAAEHRVRTLRETLQPTPEELAQPIADLDAEEVRLAAEVRRAETDAKMLDEELESLSEKERAAGTAAQKAAQELGNQQSAMERLEGQIQDLLARFPQGLDAAKSAAQVAFVEAEARVAATRQKLPAEFDKLPARNRRAAEALQQIGVELQARRAARDQAQGSLEALGGQGIYSRETELFERREEAGKRRDAARTRAWAARIGHDLIVFRKQAATKAVLAPLEQRLSAALADITGDAERRVFLDENLGIAGVGRQRDQMHAYELLSQGAREQLLLCLRLAVAETLATDEPAVLILDDVLVNTDATRQERVLDLLQSAAQRVQILVLTCHPDRYRGLGARLEIQPVRP